MSRNLIFLTRNVNRGGALYEKEVRDLLNANSNFSVDTLYLDKSKYKRLVFNKLRFMMQVKAFQLSKRYDLLITNKEGIYAGIHKKRIPKKILILHHYNEKENKYVLARGYLKNRLRSALKQIDAIVVVADYWKEIISEFTDRGKIFTIRNSFDIDFIHNTILSVNKKLFKAKYNIPNDRIVVYAGNALKEKGYKDVVNTLKGKNYFVITSGTKEDDFNSNHLHLHLNYEEYIQLLCVADVTVILSKFLEGWNRTAHESLLCGTPVIGTNTGAFGELLSQSGQMIYNEGDNLDDLISKIIHDGQRLETGMQYARQFDKRYFAKKWKQLTENLLA